MSIQYWFKCEMPGILCVQERSTILLHVWNIWISEHYPVVSLAIFSIKITSRFRRSPFKAGQWKKRKCFKSAGDDLGLNFWVSLTGLCWVYIYNQYLLFFLVVMHSFLFSPPLPQQLPDCVQEIVDWLKIIHKVFSKPKNAVNSRIKVAA